MASVPLIMNPSARSAAWDYDAAYSRNAGLVSPTEQIHLRHARIAIAGMGGVGGVHLLTLARLGIGQFNIADGDSFEVANFNRQVGAEIESIGCNKATVMAKQAMQINPELTIDVWENPIGEKNIDEFLDGCDLVVDGIDFFSIAARRLLFQRAREKGLWAVTAGPIGFSTAWLTFDPQGMTFDRYFDLHDDQSQNEQLAAFAVGLTPRASHLRYLDLTQVDLEQARGPSVSPACQLASGVIGTEITKILLNRGAMRPAPWFHQFDAYRLSYRRGRLLGGNRNPWQRIKRRVLQRRFTDPRQEPSSPTRPSVTQTVKQLATFFPLVWQQSFGRQRLMRTPEPNSVTAETANVAQYNSVMTTGLAIPYAIGMETIHRARSSASGGSALDLACGPGHFSLQMAKHLQLDHIQGFDLSEPMIETARENAALQGTDHASFDVLDITDLEDQESVHDLTTFCNAAHHFRRISEVRAIIESMERLTNRDGIVFVMDLVRLRTRSITNRYIEIVGGDYHRRGLGDFYDDFRNSMFAAWTVNEFRHAIPANSQRQWVHLSPYGLPALQILLGLPKGTRRVWSRSGVPWPIGANPVPVPMRSQWQAVRRTLASSCV